MFIGGFYGNRTIKTNINTILEFGNMLTRIKR